MLCALIIAVIACAVGAWWWRRRFNGSSLHRSRRIRLDDATWVEVMSCLDRPTLDCVERLARRFRRVVTSRFGDKCFRRLLSVELSQVYADFFVDFDEVEERSWSKGGRCDWFESKGFHDYNEAVDFLFFVMRGTAVGTLRLEQITITKYFVEKLHEASSHIAIRKELTLYDVCSTPTMLHRLFDVPFVNVAQLEILCCKLLASHIDDALLVRLAKANVKSVDFSGVSQPVDAAAYNVSEDAILDFLFRDEFNGVDDAGDRQLTLAKVAVTQHFFGRLVEHNLTSRTTGRLTLKIDRCAAQDTTLYAGHRTSTSTTDRYEFDSAVRFQLVVFPHALEMRRGTDHEDGSPFFL